MSAAKRLLFKSSPTCICKYCRMTLSNCSKASGERRNPKICFPSFSSTWERAAPTAGKRGFAPGLLWFWQVNPSPSKYSCAGVSSHPPHSADASRPERATYSISKIRPASFGSRCPFAIPCKVKRRSCIISSCSMPSGHVFSTSSARYTA